MSSDLGFVPDATQRQPDELPIGRPRDRLGQRRLSNSGRPGEGQDRAFGFADQTPYGEKLEDAILDLIEAVVVLVEDALCAIEVSVLAGLLAPRYGDEPVEVVP